MLIHAILKLIIPPTRLGVRPDSNDAGVPAAGGETVTEILARASERARQAALKYIGLVTPDEAMHLLEAGSARLIDVRAPGERELAGEVRDSLPIPWRPKSPGKEDARFAAQLQRNIKPTDVVLFLSRDGEQSHRAASAAAALGYVHALSVLEGYEGERVGRRGTRGGWRRRAQRASKSAAVESALDEALEETFPASDPIAVHPRTGRK